MNTFGNLLVIVVWMLMIICEIKISMQSLLSELENAIRKERFKYKMCLAKYKVLQSKLYVVDTNSSKSALILNANFAGWNFTLSAFKLQQVAKSFLTETVSRMIYGYDHFRPKPTKICANPASITTYVEDVIRTPNALQVDLMRHEWARYQTYSSFPRTCKIQPVRLAKAGFYYTGTYDETVCFSCGLRYKNWKPEDHPREIHQQMSPDCTFLNGSDSRNVAIERDENNTERHQQIERNDCRNNNESFQIENAASGGLNESLPATNYHYESLRNHMERTMTSTREADRNGLHEGISCNVASSLGSSEKRPPDVSKDRAKHSYYAILSNRLASFTGWPGFTNHQPRDLSSAGFYYVGTGDCVRCYFCGGGLRSWQNGDDPYVEHARWYPNCDFIRICRGDEFARQQSRGTNHSPEANCDEATATGNTLCTSLDNFRKSELTTTTAQTILSMGYSVQTVTKAITTFRVQQAGTEFTAEQLLEIILDTEENQSNNINGSSGNQSNNINGSSGNQSNNINGSSGNQSNNINGSSGNQSNNINGSSGNQSNNINGSSGIQSNNINGSSGNQRVDDLFQGEADVSTADFNSLSIRNEPSNVRTERQTSDENANGNEFESILEENRELKEQMTCKICMDAEACIVFLPCSHMMTCPQCAPAFRKCPICRALVRGTVRAFKS